MSGEAHEQAAAVLTATLCVRAEHALMVATATRRGTNPKDMLHELEAWAAQLRGRLPEGVRVEERDFSLDQPDERARLEDDPDRVLRQLLVDMQHSLTEAKKQVAVAIADEKRLAKMVEQEKLLMAEWRSRAMVAASANNTELERAALGRAMEHERLAGDHQLHWAEQKTVVDQLKEALVALNGRVEEAKRQRNLLIARAARADAKKTIEDTLEQIDKDGVAQAFHLLEGRVSAAEDRAAHRSDDASSASRVLSLVRPLGQEIEPPGPDRVARLEVAVIIPLDQASSVLERARLVTSIDHAVRFPHPSGLIRVRNEAPVFMVSDVERHRGALIAHACTTAPHAVIEQRSIGSERVELSFSNSVRTSS